MKTGLTNTLQENDQYLKTRSKYLGVDNTLYRRLHETYDPPYTETFDQYCDAMCSTDLLLSSEKVIIRKLRIQWEMNRK